MTRPDAAGWPAIEARLLAGRFVRAVNFHNTPRSRAGLLRDELARYRERFVPVGEADLEELFETGRWPHDRPGLILSFFNGYRNNVEVALPLLEEFGLLGWFFVPTAFVATPPDEQAAYAASHNLRVAADDPSGRLAMTWDEVRRLGRRHVVASHTRSHAFLAADASPEALRSEIVGSQLDLEAALGRRVRSFAWLYGDAYRPDSAAAGLMREAGYRFLFANTGIHRLPA